MKFGQNLRNLKIDHLDNSDLVIPPMILKSTNKREDNSRIHAAIKNDPFKIKKKRTALIKNRNNPKLFWQLIKENTYPTNTINYISNDKWVEYFSNLRYFKT